METCTEPVWVIDFTRIVVYSRKAVDGGIGVDTVKKKMILQANFTCTYTTVFLRFFLVTFYCNI